LEEASCLKIKGNSVKMWHRKLLLMFLITFLFCQYVWANSEGQSLSPKIGPLLKKTIQDASKNTIGKAGGAFSQDKADSRANFVKVIVVINGHHLKPLPEGLINELKERVKRLGGHIGDHAFNNVQVWIPIDKIEELAKWPNIKLIKLPTKPQVNSITSEGGDVIGVTSWHNSGLTGKGVKVGVIDLGFQGYSSLLGTELPALVNVRVFGGDINSDNHGTACAEIIHDIAPEAELYLAAISDMDVDFHNAISWFESQGVDVISSSIGINLKIYCELAYEALHTFTDINYIINILNHYEQSKEQWDYTINNAISKGITWSQASGNEGRKKWVGWFNDWDKDYYLNFEPYQNYNEIEFSNFTFGKEVYIVLLWGFDTGALSYDDYDLYVTDEFGYIVASSEIKQSLIPIAAEACRFVPIPGLKYFVWVYQYWAATQEVGLLLGADQFPNFKHFTPEGTVNLNPPAHNPNVITVGAVPYYNPYQIEDFSSQGPTLEGVIKPDLVAPDGVSTSSYGWNGFYGTSAATPHVAGACALVKQAHPQWSPSQIKSFLESRAIDLGFPGKDNVYGSGLLSLGNPPLLDIPIPDIKVNESDDPITLTQSDTLTIIVSLNNNGITDNADWWLAADTPFGLFFFTFDGWTDAWVPGYQGPLFYLDSFEVLNMPVSGLPAGTYTLYFGVDTDMDGNVTWDSLYYDIVVVNITE